MRLMTSLATSALIFGSTFAAQAQDFGFQVSNGLTLEQVVVTQETATAAPFQSRNLGSSAVITQSGQDNSAVSSITESPDAGTLVFQQGISNSVLAVIENSPGSAIAQAQFGSNNFSAAAIIGGSENGIASAQIGNTLSNSVALVDSVGTMVVYGQAGQGYSGGIVVRNAPRGTIVRLN